MKLGSAEGARFLVGEILITTVGILIALGANAWWQNHQDRGTERTSLEALRLALQNDRADLTGDFNHYLKINEAAATLIKAIDTGAPETATIDSAYGRLFDFRVHISNSSPFDALQATGIDVIASDSLRLGLLHFYAVINRMITQANEIDNKQVQQDQQPYLYRHVRFPDPSRMPRVIDLVPQAVDYPALMHDHYFRGLLQQRMMDAQVAIALYQISIAEASDLLSRIDRRIAELR